jgi:hypothetical protein
LLLSWICGRQSLVREFLNAAGGKTVADFGSTRTTLKTQRKFTPTPEDKSSLSKLAASRDPLSLDAVTRALHGALHPCMALLKG